MMAASAGVAVPIFGRGDRRSKEARRPTTNLRNGSFSGADVCRAARLDDVVYIVTKTHRESGGNA